MTQIPPPVMTLLKHSFTEHHRNMFVLIGDESKELVPVIYSVSKRLRPPSAKPAVLWCYKSELGFSTNRKKRLKEVKKLKSRGLYDPNSIEDTNFDQFASSTHVRWCYYKETERILGQTFGFLILQDFEALTPNLLARTIETVEGGGTIIFLLKTMDSLKRLYSLTMDVHVKFATVSSKFVRPRFNERFILSLSSNTNCAVLDEDLNLLPLTKLNSTTSSTTTSNEDEEEGLKSYLHSLPSTSDGILSSLTSLAKTMDQAKSIAVFVEAVSSKTLNYTISLTAARGRGKSAALGIALACAVAYGYSNIFLTAPSPENIKTVFEFAVRALDALKYVEHADYELVSSSSSSSLPMDNTRQQQQQHHHHQSNVTRINIFRSHRQTIQYIPPTETSTLQQAEMLVIDEAAAIPLPVIKKLLGPYLVLLSSTIDGYEGTGRSLSLKLFDELRVNEPKNRRSLKEISLSTPIRYGKNDPIEKWLNDLLCLDAVSKPLTNGTPIPSACSLFVVDRDTLFSRHKITEELLRRITGLMVASHYKNTPNDLQLLSDAPAHRLFVLLGGESNGSEVPDVLCVAQVAFEGNIPGQMVKEQLSQGNRASGDLIPWTISQQYQEEGFAQLSGARVVRIATHQDAFSMGYGTRMLELLERYFKGEMISNSNDDESEKPSEFESIQIEEKGDDENDDDDDRLMNEKLKPRKKLNPLLVPAADVPPPVVLDYLGVSFGMTPKLYRFWDKAGFFPLYIRQTENAVTGEFSCLMIKPLGEHKFEEFSLDFSRRFSKLLAGPFREETSSVCLAILSAGLREGKKNNKKKKNLKGKNKIDSLTIHDRQRLEAYSRNLVDHHLITDLLPRLAEIYFFDLDNDGDEEDSSISLTVLQQALLMGLGLQMKPVEKLSAELNLPVQQILALLNKAIRKFVDEKKKKSEEIPEKDQGEEEETEVDGLEAVASKFSTIKSGTLLSIPIEEKRKVMKTTEQEEDEGKKKNNKTKRFSSNSKKGNNNKKSKRG